MLPYPVCTQGLYSWLMALLLDTSTDSDAAIMMVHLQSGLITEHHRSPMLRCQTSVVPGQLLTHLTVTLLQQGFPFGLSDTIPSTNPTVVHPYSGNTLIRCILRLPLLQRTGILATPSRAHTDKQTMLPSCSLQRKYLSRYRTRATPSRNRP